jgi:hypothetical protein
MTIMFLNPLCKINTILYLSGRENYGNGGSIEEMGHDGSMMTKTVTITLSAAAAYMLLVVGLMVWCRYRRLRRKQAYLQSGAAEGTNSLCKCCVHASTCMFIYYLSTAQYFIADNFLELKWLMGLVLMIIC